MKRKEIYSGEHDGIAFELVKWGPVKSVGADIEVSSYSPMWNIYLIIFIDRIPEESNPKSFILLLNGAKIGDNEYEMYEYMSHPIFSNIDFHGGITYYEICGTHKNPAIKIGCDYAHCDDKPIHSSFERLFADAKIAIKSFRSLIPGYKYRCVGDGKLYDRSDGIIRDRHFYSKAYWMKDHPEWFTVPLQEINK